jgi:hypothetical protein
MQDSLHQLVLSIDELRQILNRPELTDEQLEQVRDDLHCFARVLIEGYLRQRKGKRSGLPR